MPSPRCGAPVRRYNALPYDQRPAPVCGRKAGHTGQHMSEDAYRRLGGGRHA